MSQGRAEHAAAEVAAALTEIALRLGGTWRIEIEENGQLRLVPSDDKA